MPRVMQWPRLDLPKAGLVRLELTTSFPEMSKTFDLLEPQLSDELDEESFFSATTYTRSKITHGIVQSALLNETEDGELVIDMAIAYDATGMLPDEPVPREMQQEALLLRVLGTGQHAGHVSCQAHFAFETEHFPSMRSILDAMPQPDFGPGFAVDEILGISGTMQIGEAPDAWPAYFFVERIPDQGIKLSLAFGHNEAVLVGEFVEQVYEEARLAASTLVLLEGR